QNTGAAAVGIHTQNQAPEARIYGARVLEKIYSGSAHGRISGRTSGAGGDYVVMSGIAAGVRNEGYGVFVIGCAHRCAVHLAERLAGVAGSAADENGQRHAALRGEQRRKRPASQHMVQHTVLSSEDTRPVESEKIVDPFDVK